MVKVIVDHSICDGDGVCADVCPMNVFDIQPSAEHDNANKSFATREEDCILCMACVRVIRDTRRGLHPVHGVRQRMPHPGHRRRRVILKPS